MFLLAVIFSLSTLAQAADEAQLSPENNKSLLIEGSYIITFNRVGEGEKTVVEKPSARNKRKGEIPFGEHSTTQSKESIAIAIDLRGEVKSIFETINAVHVEMDSEEAERLRKHPLVQSVEQDIRAWPAAVQLNPGWGLDRIDEQSAIVNSEYEYVNTGAGRDIYILDTGLTLTNPAVAAEFSGRATVIADVNGGTGADCWGHGTKVASLVAGNTYGIAKGATLKIARIDVDTGICDGESSTSIFVQSFNWLAANAPHGTIVNLSYALRNQSGCNPIHRGAVDNAIMNAHNAGIILVIAAGNDGCNTSSFSLTNITEAFVVGGTSSPVAGTDPRALFSRVGWNISTFAPAAGIQTMSNVGTPITGSGTSFAAPYIAGLFAIACQFSGTYCNTTPTATIFADLRATGTMGTVTGITGIFGPNSTSRFISQQW